MKKRNSEPCENGHEFYESECLGCVAIQPLTQLTDDKLIDLFQTCRKADEARIKAEIERRIGAKNNKPHEQDCQCTDCMGIVSEEK